MKRFVILVALLVCQQAQADTYIVAFSSYPNHEAKQVTNLLKRRVKPPIHCHYIPYARATKAALAANILWLKSKAKKGDTGIIYVSSHGSAGDKELWISTANNGPDVSSETIRKTTEALPCRSLVLIDACFSGSALKQLWRNAYVVCAAWDNEVSWTGGMSKAVCQQLRQPRHWTMRQFAFNLMRTIPACSRSQTPRFQMIPEGDEPLTR